MAPDLEAELSRTIQLLEAAPAPRERGRILCRTGALWARLGQLDQARRALREAMALLGMPLPARRRRRSLATLARQALEGELPVAVPPALAHDREALADLHEALDLLSHVLFFRRPEGWVQETLDIMLAHQATARALEAPEPLTQARLFLGYVLLLGGDAAFRRARHLLAQAVEASARLPDSGVRVTVLQDAALLLFCAGDDRRALQACEEAEGVADPAGGVHGHAGTHAVLQLVHRYRGGLARARTHAGRALEEARQAGNRVQETMGLSHLGYLQALAGRPGEALATLREAESCRGDEPLHLVELIHRVARGWALLASGEPGAAGEQARSAAGLAEAIQALPYYRAEALRLEAEALLARGQPSGPVLHQLGAASRHYPVLEAVRAVLAGRALAAEGKREAARHRIRQGLQRLQSLANPLEEGRAHRALAALSHHPDEAEEHRALAEERLREAGVEIVTPMFP